MRGSIVDLSKRPSYPVRLSTALLASETPITRIGLENHPLPCSPPFPYSEINNSSAYLYTRFRTNLIMNIGFIVVGCILAFILCPTLILFLFFSCLDGYKAYKRTKAWHKCRDQHFIDTQSPETIRCLPEKNSDLKFYDTEDEEEHHQRKAEEKADKHLTFYGKLWKEFRNQQSGKIGSDEMKKKDREERRKLAKAVVRELDLRERNKAKNTNKVHSPGTL